jgi:hypothetical protein
MAQIAVRNCSFRCHASSAPRGNECAIAQGIAWLHHFHRARVVIVRILHSVWRGAVQFGRARPISRTQFRQSVESDAHRWYR